MWVLQTVFHKDENAAVAIMSHVSLLQRVRFAWKRYRHVDPGLAQAEPEAEAAPDAAATAQPEAS